MDWMCSHYNLSNKHVANWSFIWKISFEIIYNAKPSLSHLRVFKCLCFSTILNYNDKFSNKSKKYILIGFSSTKKIFKLYGLTKKHFCFQEMLNSLKIYFPLNEYQRSKYSCNWGKNKSFKLFFNLHENEFQSLSKPNDKVKDLPVMALLNHLYISNHVLIPILVRTITKCIIPQLHKSSHVNEQRLWLVQ